MTKSYDENPSGLDPSICPTCGSRRVKIPAKGDGRPHYRAVTMIEAIRVAMLTGWKLRCEYHAAPYIESDAVDEISKWFEENEKDH